MSREVHITAIIPARYASTRLPGKPLIDLCGKPMIQRVVEQVKQAGLVDDVIVATDDERIGKAVMSFGGNVIMTPSTIATGSDRIAFVAEQLPTVDIAVNVQGDEPLIAPQMIDEAIRPLLDDRRIEVGTLVKKISSPDDLDNASVVKVVIDGDGCAIYFSRSPIPYFRDGVHIDSWHAKHTYYKHVGLYVFRREFLMKFASWKESTLECIEKLEQLRIIEHGHRIKATITDFDSIPVDTAEDAERVRSILMKQHTVNTQ